MADAATTRGRIAAEVRAEMARQNKTQREIAAILGIPQPSLCLRVNGERSFRAEELAVLAEALDVPVERFMAGAA